MILADCLGHGSHTGEHGGNSSSHGSREAGPWRRKFSPGATALNKLLFMKEDKVRLGVSACLLGQSVRYNGGHKLDHFITDTLGPHVEFVPVCPEVECGLPVPREAMRMVGNPEAPRLMTQRTQQDLTGQMLTWASKRVVELEKEDLCGFIFKSKSPSSGMERVKVYNGRGGLSGRAPGMFAREFMRHFPLLPAEDDGRLNDPLLRENFIERVFALKRYRDTLQPKPTLQGLMKFHKQHKFLIMAHSQKEMRALGTLLGRAEKGSAKELADRYEETLLPTLKLKATPRKHANVLQHMLGFLKNDLTAEEKKEMLDLIQAMRDGILPLIVPMILLEHYVRKYDVSYLRDQYYLTPHPLELKLRNHA